MNRNKDIKEELEELAPTLAAIPLSKIYEVPEGYFESIEIVVSEKLGSNKSYSVPDGYFEKMQEEVLQKVATPTKVRSIFSARNIMGIAASMILLISAMIWMQVDSDKKDGLAEEEFTIEESLEEEFVLQNLDDFDISELYDEEDFSLEDMESEVLVEFVEDNLLDYDIDQIEGLL